MKFRNPFVEYLRLKKHPSNKPPPSLFVNYSKKNIPNKHTYICSLIIVNNNENKDVSIYCSRREKGEKCLSIYFLHFSLFRAQSDAINLIQTHINTISKTQYYEQKYYLKNICDRVYLCLCVNAPIIYSTSIFNTLKFLDLNSTTE